MSVLIKDVSKKRVIARGGTESKTIERWLQGLADGSLISVIATGSTTARSLPDWFAPVSSLSTSVQSTGNPGLDGQSFFIYKAYTTAPGGAGHPSGETAVFRAQRYANYTGGTPGSVESAVWAEHDVAAGVANFEWTIRATLNNSATAGENVAVYAAAHKDSTGPTWGLVSEAHDRTGNADPNGACVGIETDVVANGTDANGVRVGHDIVGFKYGAGATATISHAIRIGPYNNDAAEAVFTNGITLNKTFTRGIDLTNANCATADIITKGSVHFGAVSSADAPDRRLHSTVSDAVTAAVTYAARLTHVTSGTAAASFGVGLEAEWESAGGNNRVGGALDWAWRTATDAAENAVLNVMLMNAGAAAAQVARFDSRGRLGVGLSINPAVDLDVGSTTDAIARVVGGSVDIRVTANNTSGVGQIGTTSAHDLILNRGGSAILRLAAAALSPNASDGAALGTTALMWSDLFLASGAVVNFNNGDVTVTHLADTLAFAGASSGYTFDSEIIVSSAVLGHSSTALTNGAAAQTATLTNGPAAGNPTKWAPFNDNGTTRYVPMW